jgi:hypothetical protein
MSEDNVIQFPKVAQVNIDASSAQNMIDDMKETKMIEVSNFLAESILMAGAKEMVAHGVDVEDAEFLKDYAFALEALRSCLLRHGKVHHDFQDLVDRYCKFNVIKNRAGTIAQVGLTLCLEELSELDDDYDE